MAQSFVRVSHQAARYTLMGSMREHCGQCRFFLKNNLCARVIGDISASAWCKFFSREAVARGDAGGGAAARHSGGGPPSLDLSLLGPTLDPRITFTRASVGTYFDVAGVMQTATANTPRFGFDPVTHVARGLLIEEQRINVLLNSATLGTQSVAVTAQQYSLSFYGTGTITLSGTSTAGPLVGTGVFPQRVSLTFTPTAGTLTCTVSGSVLSAQLEAGAFSTSYIPTTAAAATRTPEVATMSAVGLFSPVAGSLVVDDMKVSITTGNGWHGAFGDATAANEVGMFIGPATGAQAFFRNASVTIYNPNAPTPYTIGAVIKTGITWQPGIGSWAINGVMISSAGVITGTIPTVPSLAIGCRSAGFNQLNGYIRRMRYWPRVLADAELQQVTT